MKRGTLVLVAVALALLAVVLLWERKTPGTEELGARQGRLFPEATADAVTRVVLERPTGKLTVDKQAGGAWRMLEPLADRADRYAVEDLVRQLVEARGSASVPLAELKGGLETAGLAPAERLAATLTASGATLALEIGGREAPGGLRYARRAGEATLALVPAPLGAALARPLDAWRDHALCDVATPDVTAARIAAAGHPGLSLARHGATWRLAAPIDDVAQDGLVSTLLGHAAGARAEAFVGGEPGAAFGEPALSVTLERSSGTACEFALGAETAPGSGRRVARVAGRPGLFEVLAGELLADAGRDPAAWRSTLLVDVTPAELKRLRLERGGATKDLDPAAREVRVQEALAALTHVEAETIADGVSAAAAGLERPAARAVFEFSAAGREPLALEIGGAGPAGTVYARVSGRRTIFTIKASTAGFIAP